MISSKQGKQADKPWMAFCFMGTQPSSAGCADSCGKWSASIPGALQAWLVKAAGDSATGSVPKAEEVQMHWSNLQRNRVGVKGACGSAAALMLGADQTSFRAWVSPRAIGLVRVPAVLTKVQWQCS